MITEALAVEMRPEETPAFQPFPKISRISRECVITEKIDGTNAVVYVGEDGRVVAGSRTRWLFAPQGQKDQKGADNFGFASWVLDHTEELRELGPGWHYGEWWGAGIQRRYGLAEKRFSLFNVGKWIPWVDPTKFHPLPQLPEQKIAPPCCHVVPVLARGVFSTYLVDEALEVLRIGGSFAAPGFHKPEGVVVYHEASKTLFKRLIEGDEIPKGKEN